jgi:hypothetical protein
MDTRIHDAWQPLCIIAAGSITTSFAGNLQDLQVYNQNAFDGLGTGTDPVRPAFANELTLWFTKTQGSADQIWIQVQESDDSFTTAVIVPIMGQEYHIIASSTYTDSINYRLPHALQIRGKEVRVLAKYSGGAATSAAISVLGKLMPTNEFSHQGAVTVLGASGLVADVKKTDLVTDKGLAYSAAVAVTAGTWAADVVTITQTAHGYDVGTIVVVSGCGNANYDDTYTLLSVPTVDTWTAALVGDPGAFTTAGTGIQAQSTTRLIDETKAWTADEHASNDRYVEITSGTGNKQYAAITDNGNQWLEFAAMTTAPVTSDSMYKIIELDVNGLVVNTELDVKIGSIAVNSIENYKYIASPPDLAAGETCMGRADIKGNVQVVGPEAHDAAANRAPVRIAGYANDAAPTDVADADVVNAWYAQNGAAVIAGRNQDGTSSDIATALDVGTDNVAATTLGLLRVGGIARAAGATYTEGDSSLFTTDLKGGLRVGGNVAHDATYAGNPVLLGAYASDVIQAAVTAAGDATRLWASLNGALLGAGLYQHATANLAVAMTNPVVIDDAVMFTGATAIPVAGQYNATPLTYTDKDACVFQMTDSGELITTGGVGESDLTHGQNTVAVPGTEEALGGNVPILAGQTVSIKALHTNTDAIFVGDSDVTSADGYVLYPGEEVSLAVTNLNIPYIDSVVAGEGVSFIVEVS